MTDACSHVPRPAGHITRLSRNGVPKTGETSRQTSGRTARDQRRKSKEAMDCGLPHNTINVFLQYILGDSPNNIVDYRALFEKQ